MANIADVCINISTKAINKLFSYVIPSDMGVIPGWRVMVPFGSRTVEGFVVTTKQASEAGLKSIKCVVEEFAWFDDNMLKTAKWIKDYYLCSLAEAMQLFVMGKQVSSKTIQFVELTQPQEAQIFLDTQLKGKPAQQRLVLLLLTKGSISIHDLLSNKVTRPTIHKLVQIGVAKIISKQSFRDSYRNEQKTYLPMELTNDQINVLSKVNIFIENKEFKSFLLHGVTGSGKTQVYIEIVTKVRQQGRQAIVMVPEIALTGQIVARFKARFGDDVVVLHSRLSAGERADAWHKLKLGEAGIVVGARSAVFAPVPNLGVIILDEEHEFTYKQEESPRYHARNVAIKRAQLAQGVVVLGSATPTVETFYEASQGKHILLKLPNRIGGSELPKIELVDMRQELKAGRKSVLSLKLQELLAETLERKEQAIILLNRRGYATFVMCRECGYVLRCKHCDISLVYHLNGSVLKCHYCQSLHSIPDICPNCGSRYIKYFGTGTQRVEEDIKQLFPLAKVIRMDQDTTTKKYSHDKILQAFNKHEYDILLGTQMVAKGHDIANVTAVGIISADTALNLPDFRAAERTFSLITQAAGRAGRGKKKGAVIVQTYNPENYAIQAGALQDYQQFYESEIVCRKPLGYPPFGKLVRLTFRDTNENLVKEKSETYAQSLRLYAKDQCQIIGPFASTVPKVNDVYRIHILMKTNELAIVREILQKCEIDTAANIIVDVEPLNVL